MKINKSMIVKIIGIICVTMAIMSVVNQSHGVIGAIVGIGAIALIFVWAGQLFAVGIALALKGIMVATTAAMSGNNSGVYSMTDIFFNKSGATTAGFFNGIGIKGYTAPGTISQICSRVTEWYYIIRNISIAALLFILLYIGIRMAISTVASKEAKYKKMLIDWTVSLVLVFMLHYIMIATFYVNNTLVSALETQLPPGGGYDGNLLLTGLNAVLVPYAGIDEAIIFCGIVISEFLFFIMYVKRFITLAFLIVIAPLITITYAIDKIGDGKSQALNTWLKEFIFTVIIQPFHCILYLVLIQTVLQSASGINGIASGILYIIMLNFVRQAENIVKKIFNIRADSLPDSGAMAAVTMGVMSSILGKDSKDKSGNETGKKMPNMAEEAGKTAKNKNENTKTKKDKTEDLDGGDGKDTDDDADGKDIDLSDDNDSHDDSNDDSDSDGAPTPADSTSTDDSNNKDKRKKGKLSPIGEEIKNTMGLFMPSIADENSKVTDYVKDAVKLGAKGGGALFGASAGLTLGDASKAVTLGMAGYAGAKKISSAIEGVDTKLTLKGNQEYFASAVNDYAYAYAQENGLDEVDYDLAIQDAINQWETYQDGGKDLEDFTESQRDFLKMCEQMDDTYSHLGASDSSAAVKQTIKMAARGEIKEAKGYNYKYKNQN